MKTTGIFLLGYVECRCGNRAPAELSWQDWGGQPYLMVVRDQLPEGWLIRSTGGVDFFQCPEDTEAHK